MINIKTRVNFEGSGVVLVEEVTLLVTVNAFIGLVAWGRELQILVEEVGVTTVIVLLLELGHESLVEGEDVVVSETHRIVYDRA